MKTIYKPLVTSLLLTFAGMAVFAQNANDTTLNRQILLERAYTPTIQDASKINTVPAVNEPVVEKINFNFETGQPRFSSAGYPLGDTGSGDVNSAILFNKKRGYLGLNAGTYINLDANLGYRIVDGANDVLDVFARHNSTSGDINYLQEGYFLDKAKAKYSDNLVKLNYKHIFESMDLSLRGSFFNMGYNHYGNPYLNYDFGDAYDLKTKQNVDVFNVGASVKSTHSGLLNYKVGLDYHNFSTKHGLLTNDGGLTGNILKTNVDLSTALGSDKLVGLDMNLLSQSFGDVGRSVKDEDYHSMTNIKLSPYLKIDGENWRTSLGANMNYVFDAKNKMLFSPNVTASIDVTETSVLYGSLTGGLNENTFLDILAENRYADLASRVAYSKTLYDFKAGFKSGVISGFEFDLFAGYKQTDGDHLFVPGSSAYHYVGGIPAGSLANIGRVLYADIKTGHLGGGIKTNLIPYTDLSAKLTSYFYSVKMLESGYENKAWNRPTLAAEAQAVVKPIDKLSLTADFLYAAGRKTMKATGTSADKALRMKNIVELNVKGEYELKDWLSLNVQLRNVLNAKYDLWRGYTQQGFNALAGVNLKF